MSFCEGGEREKIKGRESNPTRNVFNWKSYKLDIKNLAEINPKTVKCFVNFCTRLHIPFRRNKLQSDIHSLLQPKEKRDYILKELLETEYNYVEVGQAYTELEAFVFCWKNDI